MLTNTAPICSCQVRSAQHVPLIPYCCPVRDSYCHPFAHVILTALGCIPVLVVPTAGYGLMLS